jgi:predicted Zn-ribbon and HTH transcriptional regulator
MTPAVNESETGSRRDSSRLDVDDMFHCKECGIELPWQAVLIGEYGKCRKCKKEERERQFRLEYPREWAALGPYAGNDPEEVGSE